MPPRHRLTRLQRAALVAGGEERGTSNEVRATAGKKATDTRREVLQHVALATAEFEAMGMALALKRAWRLQELLT